MRLAIERTVTTAADRRRGELSIMAGLARRLIFATWWLIIPTCLPTTADAQVTPVRPTSRAVENIGNAAPRGWSVLGNDPVTLSAVTDISGETVHSRFEYQILSGDVQIAARLDSLAPAQMGSKAGLMIR